MSWDSLEGHQKRMTFSSLATIWSKYYRPRESFIGEQKRKVSCLSLGNSAHLHVGSGNAGAEVHNSRGIRTGIVTTDPCSFGPGCSGSNQKSLHIAPTCCPFGARNHLSFGLEQVGLAASTD